MAYAAELMLDSPDSGPGWGQAGRLNPAQDLPSPLTPLSSCLTGHIPHCFPLVPVSIAPPPQQHQVAHALLSMSPYLQDAPG